MFAGCPRLPKGAEIPNLRISLKYHKLLITWLAKDFSKNNQKVLKFYENFADT